MTDKDKNPGSCDKLAESYQDVLDLLITANRSKNGLSTMRAE